MPIKSIGRAPSAYSSANKVARRDDASRDDASRDAASQGVAAPSSQKARKKVHFSKRVSRDPKNEALLGGAGFRATASALKKQTLKPRTRKGLRGALKSAKKGVRKRFRRWKQSFRTKEPSPPPFRNRSEERSQKIPETANKKTLLESLSKGVDTLFHSFRASKHHTPSRHKTKKRSQEKTHAPPAARPLMMTGDEGVDQLLRMPRIAEAARAEANMKNSDLCRTVEGLLLQEALAEGGEAAVEAVLSGKSLSEALPHARLGRGFDDLREAARFLESFDAPRQRITALSEKMETGAISQSERHELARLLALHRTTLPLLQKRLGELLMRHGQEAGTEKPIHVPYLISTQAVALSLAEHHMALADATARYGEALPDAEGGRADLRMENNLRGAEGMLLALKEMDSCHLLGDHEKAQALMGEISLYRDHVKETLAVRRPDAARGAPRGTPMPLGKILERAPAFLDPKIPTTSDLYESARADFKSAVRQGRITTPPLTHAILNPKDMLEVFIEARADADGVQLPESPVRHFFYEKGRLAAIAQSDWGKIQKVIPLADGTTLMSAIHPAIHSLAPHFLPPYEGRGISEDARAEPLHIRNLAETTLQSDDNRILFRGLRHAALHPYGITPQYLSAMPGAALALFLENHLPSAALEGRSPAQMAYQIHSGAKPQETENLCKILQKSGAEHMAKEIAIASLCAHPSLYKKALQGEVVSLPMNVISLMTPDLFRRREGSDRRILQQQNAALRSLENGGAPLTIALRDDEGQARDVRIRVQLRQFNFGIDKPAREVHGIRMTAPVLRNLVGWSYSAGLNNPALENLLGPVSEEGIGGALEPHINERMQALRGISRQKDDLLRLDPQAQREETARELLRLDAKGEELDHDMRALLQCALQVKQLWRSGGFRDTAHDPCKMTARLALLCHMIGETPIFGDTDGGARTEQMDSEVKYLATRLYGEGALPAPGEENESTAPLRARFLLQGGNEELRAANQGNRFLIFRKRFPVFPKPFLYACRAFMFKGYV